MPRGSGTSQSRAGRVLRCSAARTRSQLLFVALSRPASVVLGPPSPCARERCCDAALGDPGRRGGPAAAAARQALAVRLVPSQDQAHRRRTRCFPRRTCREGATQRARRRTSGRSKAVPARGAFGAQAARARHAAASGPAPRTRLQRVARLTHAGAIRPREPAVRHGVGVLHGGHVPRHDGAGRAHLRVVRRARQEVPRRRAAVRRLRHDLHAEDRQRRDSVPYEICERVPRAVRGRGAARGAAAVPRGGAHVRGALPPAGAAAPARAPAPHLRAPHRARQAVLAARPQGD